MKTHYFIVWCGAKKKYEENLENCILGTAEATSLNLVCKVQYMHEKVYLNRHHRA